MTLAAGDRSDWRLVWQDEFEGKTLDLSKWEFEVNAQGGGNNELQYYVTNNVRVKDGRVLVHPQPNPAGTRAEPASIEK